MWFAWVFAQPARVVRHVSAVCLLKSEHEGVGSARGRQTPAAQTSMWLLRTHVSLPELAAQTLAQITSRPTCRSTSSTWKPHQHRSTNSATPPSMTVLTQGIFRLTARKSRRTRHHLRWNRKNCRLKKRTRLWWRLMPAVHWYRLICKK